jgi:phage tail sheath protein FI
MADYLAPGVYVEEFASGVQGMAGVSTSVAGFIGMAERGRTVGKPVLVTSAGDFQRKFGGHLKQSEYGINSYMPYAVDAFFANGGSTAYVMRVEADGAQSAKTADGLKIKFTAASSGKWGNTISVSLTESFNFKTNITAQNPADKGFVFTLKDVTGYNIGDVIRITTADSDTPAENYFSITDINNRNITALPADGAPPANGYDAVDTAAVPKTYVQLCTVDITVSIPDGTTPEVYHCVTLNPQSPYFIKTELAESALVSVDIGDSKSDGFAIPAQSLSSYLGLPLTVALTGGDNGKTAGKITPDMLSAGEDLPNKRKGLLAFNELDNVSIITIPGYSDLDIQAALVAYCENRASMFAVLDAGSDDTEAEKLLTYKSIFNTSYAAIYAPWVETYSDVEKKKIFIPPSGAIAGIYARTDNSRGVWKAPANETVKNVTKLKVDFNAAEQGVLNPKGINLIRNIPGQGIVAWGARTLSSDVNWRYINVRRLFIYIEQSIKTSTNWVVFEPNDSALWSRVQGSVQVFLTSLWRSGALVGSSPDQAFFVNIGPSTMTQDDILNGRLICVIGVAPVRPAEFVIFRITQNTSESQ